MKNTESKNCFSRGVILIMISVVVAFLAASALAYYVMVYRQSDGSSALADVYDSKTEFSVDDFEQNISQTPTSVPFQEITIPALRQREYQSSLEGLQKLADKENFTSYLTNYDSDNLKINGYITIPHGQIPEGGWPAVVFVHGYIPPEEYETIKSYISYADALADKELVVFKIDLRGHDDSEGEITSAYYSEGYVVDVLNAYRALQQSDFVNPNKVGLWGHSMAGNIVFRSKVVMPEIAKVVIWAGAVYSYKDFLEYRINDNSYQPPSDESEYREKREKLFEIYGNFDSESEFWKKVIPTNYLDEVKGNFQLHHAVDDDVVKVEYSRNLVQILDQHGIENELFEYQSGGHNITGNNFEKAMDRSAEFLISY